MIGQTISHYRILQELGRGGMGVVYQATDLKLKRTVALKFLAPHLLADPDQSQRFIHEAQAAAALDHPNIATVHEVHEAEGHTFIVMAYIEGEDLGQKIDAEPLPIADALDITIQIARGLAKAHAAGIVHRDVKPGNVIVTPDGLVKVLDFGLAKLATQTRLTRTGTTLGTVRYMSPEQANSESVDHRSDIWSLGVILYEMLTGRSPFPGDLEAARVYSILNKDPLPVSELRQDIPLVLEDIVEKALAKDPEKRYASMDELLAELEPLRDQITLLGIQAPGFSLMRRLKRRKRRVAGVATVLVLAAAVFMLQTIVPRGTGIDALAVLPFTNLSGDPEQDYFSDGMTEILINELGRISALKVISRTSVMQYKGTDQSLAEIARELDVDAVVEASVLRSGDEVMITAQLIKVEPEQQIWADSFERDTRDILKVHSQMTRAIAEQIQIAVSDEERVLIERDREVDPAAFNALLRGSHYSGGDWNKAIRHIREAIDIDPTYAEAYALLAEAYNRLNLFGEMTLQESAPKAKAAALQALELDENIGSAHAELGWVKWHLDNDVNGAEKEYRRAVELSPNSGAVHMGYDLFLTAMGRYDEAIFHAKKAIDTWPLWTGRMTHLAWVYFYAGRGDDVIRACRQALKEGAGEEAYEWLAQGYLLKGMNDEAIAALDSSFVLRTGPATEEDLMWAGYILGHAGATDRAEAYLDSLLVLSENEFVKPDHIALVYGALGHADEMFVWLEKGFETGEIKRIEKLFDPYREDPRYLDLARRMNISKSHLE